jgi:hypothetical protein
VRWSNFVEIAATSNLHGYSRLLSNWYRVRQKLAATSVNTTLHRISAKRVVIEITEAKCCKRSNQRTRPLLFLTGGVLLVLVAISSLAISATNSDEVGRRELEQAVFASPTSPATCKNVADYAGLEIADLREFDAGSWKIRTYSEVRTLGSVWFVNFEAECSGQLVDGLLTAQHIDGGYRILRMTPT